MTGCVLVTGGAGYIGSHTTLALLAAGWRVVVVDDLTTGRRELVPPQATFVVADAGDSPRLTEVMRRHGCTAVVHFAGSTVVPESLADPIRYYGNNTCVSRNLIAACLAAGVGCLVFSSTAAVYGDPARLPVDEEAPPRPITPYGTSKLMVEWMLRDVAATGRLRHVALRYFNVAGADPFGRSGQSTPNATHLIKVACEVACGRRRALTIYGDDYDTPDGTCVRDFIHVSDLAEAHVAALDHLTGGGSSLTLNCGYGWGLSVRQVVAAIERVGGMKLAVEIGPRRPGDIVRMVAASERIRSALGWRPRHDSVDEIVGSALRWEAQAGQPAWPLSVPLVLRRLPPKSLRDL